MRRIITFIFSLMKLNVNLKALTLENISKIFELVEKLKNNPDHSYEICHKISKILLPKVKNNLILSSKEIFFFIENKYTLDDLKLYFYFKTLFIFDSLSGKPQLNVCDDNKVKGRDQNKFIFTSIFSNLLGLIVAFILMIFIPSELLIKQYFSSSTLLLFESSIAVILFICLGFLTYTFFLRLVQSFGYLFYINQAVYFANKHNFILEQDMSKLFIIKKP